MRERLVKRNVKHKTLQPIYMKNFIQWFIRINSIFHWLSSNK